MIFDEPGSDQVAQYLPGALVSSVNVAEVATRLHALDMPGETIETVIETLQLTILSFDYEQALATGALRFATKSAGLSLGDRSCLACAVSRQASACTADTAWSDVAKPAGVDVIQIR